MLASALLMGSLFTSYRGDLCDFDTHWTWPGREGQPMTVRCYVDEEAELFLNGKKLGTKRVPAGRNYVEYVVPYAPGELLLRGRRNGRAVVANSIVTAGPVSKLLIVPDSKLGSRYAATVKAADEKGVVNPTASGKEVRFSVEGPAKFVSPDRATFEAGLARVEVERTGEGVVSLVATAEGMTPAVVTYGFTAPELTAKSFTVASVNVRAVMACDPTPNRWDERAPRIAEIAERAGFDICALQEAEEPWCTRLCELLPGWRQYYCGREKDLQGESASLIWNGERFDILDKGTFWLSDTPDVPGSITWGGAPRSATWGLFLDKKTGRRFRLFSTHLECSSLEARVKGMKLILDRIQAAYEKDPVPVVFCGDMNISLYYKKLPISADHPIVAAMKVMKESWDASETPHLGPFGSWDGFTWPCRVHENPDGQIDHIFVKGDIRVLTSRTVRMLPNGLHASDHDFIASDVEL